MSIKMAQLYEKAWHELFYKRARFAQEDIINDPHGKRANELAHEVAKLAESRAYDLDKKKQKQSEDLITGNAPF